MDVYQSGTTYSSRVIVPSVDGMISRMKENEKSQYYIITMEHIHIQELIISLIQSLITKYYCRCALITIDRPFNYTMKLLKSKGVNTERLFLIDVITSITSERFEIPKNVFLLRSPFCSDLKEDLSTILSGKLYNEKELPLDQLHFLIVDNISILEHYVERDSIDELFKMFEMNLRRYPMLKTILIIDEKKYKRIYDGLKEWINDEINL